MSSLSDVSAPSRVVLAAETAQDLMTPQPTCIPETTRIADAARLLTSKRFSAVPVVNAGGRPVGVLSRADIVRHACECLERAKRVPDDEPSSNLWALGPMDGMPLPANTDATEVRMVMTPIVCTVSPETPALRVVEGILARQVHRLFVVRDGVLVGIITTMDVLRKLRSGAGRVETRDEAAESMRSAAMVEELTHAHVALLRELRKLHGMAHADGKSCVPELASRLQSTRGVITQHFRLEEQNGYLDVVRKRQPQADHAIQKLRDEHRELLDSLSALLAQAQAPAATQESLGPKVTEWIARVRAHEARENTLVQDAFNLDISAED